MSDDIVVAAVRSIEYQNETGKSLRVAATHASRQKGITAQQTKVFHRAKQIKQSMTEETPKRKKSDYVKGEEPAEYHFRKFMEAIGQPPDSSEHLEDTPRRVTEAFRDEFFSGVDKDPKRHLETTFGEVEKHKGDAGFVIVDDIQVQSVCAHHLLPIRGRAHVGYVPRERVVGLSKLARVTKEYARRPQVQERITNQVADAVQDVLEPLATFVVIDAEHGCMSCRGVEEPFSSTTTSARRGPKGSELEEKFYTLLDL